jgi:hypothetical protein
MISNAWLAPKILECLVGLLKKLGPAASIYTKVALNFMLAPVNFMLMLLRGKLLVKSSIQAGYPLDSHFRAFCLLLGWL